MLSQMARFPSFLWIMFLYMYIYNIFFVYSSIEGQTHRLIVYLGHYKQYCNEHGGTHIFAGLCFFFFFFFPLDKHQEV